MGEPPSVTGPAHEVVGRSDVDGDEPVGLAHDGIRL